MALFMNAFTKLRNLWPWRKAETITSQMQTQQAIAKSRESAAVMRQKYAPQFAKAAQKVSVPPAKVSWRLTFSSFFSSTSPISSKNYNKRPVNNAKSASWWSWPFTSRTTKQQNISSHLPRK